MKSDIPRVSSKNTRATERDFSTGCDIITAQRSRFSSVNLLSSLCQELGYSMTNKTFSFEHVDEKNFDSKLSVN